MPGRIDRRGITRGWIVQSFNRLMQRRSYDAFGVTDVVTGAGVGRSTFYEHFHGKDEVLRDAVSGIVDALAGILDRPGDDGPPRRVAEHIATHRRIAHRILASSAGERIVRQLAGRLTARLGGRTPRAGLTRAAVAEQIARAQMGLLRAWTAPLEEPFPPAALAEGWLASTRALVDAMTSAS